MTGILQHLKWESLKKRRRDSSLILLYKGLKGKASILTPPDHQGLALPDSLISSAEGAEDGVAKFTSLVRARD